MNRYKRDPINYSSMVNALIRKRREGCDHVTFTGGEPTLHPKFPDVLKAAKRLGFKTYMTTDGQLLADRGYAARVLPNLDEFCISIHGPNAEVHDALVKKKGSFERIIKAFSYVGSFAKRSYLLTNTVMTQQNYKDLAETVRFLLTFDVVRHLTLSNLAPDGDALVNYRDLALTLTQIKSIVPELAALAKKKGVVIRFFAVPLCVLPDDPELSNDLNWDPRVTVERGDVDGKVGLQEIYSRNPGRMRFFPAECGGCTAQERCWGIFKTYYEHYGAKEVSPLPAHSAVNSVKSRLPASVHSA